MAAVSREEASPAPGRRRAALPRDPDPRRSAAPGARTLLPGRAGLGARGRNCRTHSLQRTRIFAENTSPALLCVLVGLGWWDDGGDGVIADGPTLLNNKYAS